MGDKIRSCDSEDWDKSIWRFHAMSSVEFNIGTSIDKMCLPYFDEGKEFEGKEMLVKGGYDQLCH